MLCFLGRQLTYPPGFSLPISRMGIVLLLYCHHHTVWESREGVNHVGVHWGCNLHEPQRAHSEVYCSQVTWSLEVASCWCYFSGSTWEGLLAFPSETKHSCCGSCHDICIHSRSEEQPDHAITFICKVRAVPKWLRIRLDGPDCVPGPQPATDKAVNIGT